MYKLDSLQTNKLNLVSSRFPTTYHTHAISCPRLQYNSRRRGVVSQGVAVEKNPSMALLRRRLRRFQLEAQLLLIAQRCKDIVLQSPLAMLPRCLHRQHKCERLPMQSRRAIHMKPAAPDEKQEDSTSTAQLKLRPLTEQACIRSKNRQGSAAGTGNNNTLQCHFCFVVLLGLL